MAIVGLAGVVSAFVVLGLSDRIGRKRAIGILAPLGPILFQTIPAMIGIMLFAGCFTLGAIPLMMSTVPMEPVSPSQRATAVALVLAVGQIIGGVVGPIIGSVMADEFGSATPLLLAALFAGLASVISLLLTESASLRTSDKSSGRVLHEQDATR